MVNNVNNQLLTKLGITQGGFIVSRLPRVVAGNGAVAAPGVFRGCLMKI